MDGKYSGGAAGGGEVEAGLAQPGNQISYTTTASLLPPPSSPSSPTLNPCLPSPSGWLAKIKLSDEAQFNVLLNEAEYKTLCEGQ